MNVSHASVHPVEEVATTEAGDAEQNGVVHIPWVRMKDIRHARHSRWTISIMALLSLLVTSTLTFATACASAGITVLTMILKVVYRTTVQFETATGMAFICWFNTAIVSPQLLVLGISMIQESDIQKLGIMCYYGI